MDYKIKLVKLDKPVGIDTKRVYNFADMQEMEKLRKGHHILIKNEADSITLQNNSIIINCSMIEYDMHKLNNYILNNLSDFFYGLRLNHLPVISNTTMINNLEKNIFPFAQIDEGFSFSSVSPTICLRDINKNLLSTMHTSFKNKQEVISALCKYKTHEFLLAKQETLAECNLADWEAISICNKLHKEALKGQCMDIDITTLKELCHITLPNEFLDRYESGKTILQLWN